jgi:hypothetical protein
MPFGWPWMSISKSEKLTYQEKNSLSQHPSLSSSQARNFNFSLFFLLAATMHLQPASHGKQGKKESYVAA